MAPCSSPWAIPAAVPSTIIIADIATEVVIIKIPAGWAK
jgi:hypothetical protein